MGNAAFSWQNYADGATITTGSEEANLPGSLVADPHASPEYAWQTVDGVIRTSSGATITIKPTVLRQTWRVAVVAGCNVTPGASVTFTLKNIASPSDTTVATVVVSGPPSGIGQIVALFSADQTADYLTIDFEDPNNPDNHINVPLVWCGALWLPEVGRSPSSGYAAMQRLDEFVTLGGQTFTDARWQARQTMIELDALTTATEQWQSVAAMARVARSGGNILAIPDITSALVNYEAVVGLATVSDFRHTMRTAARISATVTVTERL